MPDKIDVALSGTNRKIFLATISTVTIAPLAGGVSESCEIKIPNDDNKGTDDVLAYFIYYTYFPFDEAHAFRTGVNLSFTQILHVDNGIRVYKKTSRSLTMERNNQQPGRNRLVDLDDIPNRIPSERNQP